ncbi:hypothetical protein [Pleomorphomonas sp. T1.2MG-36]|uniref:hypothetical protein n=1 Tax=Pleomorphomonas sp. T1.2MG-36 TaxID=3041167 RepID=UPI0025410016|nr:hypothetical protein [Pleomorphomonas sp. T1.2MG-36]
MAAVKKAHLALVLNCMQSILFEPRWQRGQASIGTTEGYRRSATEAQNREKCGENQAAPIWAGQPQMGTSDLNFGESVIYMVNKILADQSLP